MATPSTPLTPRTDQVRHDILLIIATGLFIFFATGILGPQRTPVEPIVIP
ncbi:MAG TPA: hypothetical protein VHY08_26320 [Bacillota bacterium]|nr:hypothetical protein [Bacillota bacterium]